MKHSLASLPNPFRYSFASGSVLEAWVWLRLRWPRKLFPLPRQPFFLLAGGRGSSSSSFRFVASFF